MTHHASRGNVLQALFNLLLEKQLLHDGGCGHVVRQPANQFKCFLFSLPHTILLEEQTGLSIARRRIRVNPPVESSLPLDSILATGYAVVTLATMWRKA